jgi:hypothetical protein
VRLLRPWLSAACLAVALGGALAPTARAQTVVSVNNWAAWWAAFMGNLNIVNNGSLQYTYTRDGFYFELRSRDGSWSFQEALWLRDAIDQMPDVYLQKVQATGTYILYRDGASPVAPWSWFYSPAHIIAVAVPPWPWNYVSFADGTFSSADEVYFTCTHEFGHCAEWNETGWGILFGCNFTRISWVGFVEPMGLQSWNGFARDYSFTNQREDYADACAYYWIAPDQFYGVSPAKYWYMRNNVFGGQVSPASARRSLYIHPWRYPEVDGMTGNEGHVADFNAIYGQRFMGPFDGGFNTVWYGGGTATHVPISNSTIWSWVPDSGGGWQVLSVQTQDGWSNGSWFYNEGKPWWMFW